MLPSSSFWCQTIISTWDFSGSKQFQTTMWHNYENNNLLTMKGGNTPLYNNEHLFNNNNFCHIYWENNLWQLVQLHVVSSVPEWAARVEAAPPPKTLPVDPDTLSSEQTISPFVWNLEQMSYRGRAKVRQRNLSFHLYAYWKELFLNWKQTMQ